MLRRLLQCRAAVVATIAQSSYCHDEEHNLSHEEWDTLNQLCRFLEPFEEATDRFQAQRYPTLGYVSRIICNLFKSLRGQRAPKTWLLLVDYWSEVPAVVTEPTWASLSLPVQDLRAFIRDDLQRRWDPLSDEPDLLLGIGAAVHPGHKGLEWLPAPAVDCIWDAVLGEMCNVAGVQAEDEQQPQPAAQAPEHKGEGEEPQQKRARRSVLWDDDEDLPAAPALAPAAGPVHCTGESRPGGGAAALPRCSPHRVQVCKVQR
jgi:hypothetical protein